MVLCVCGADKNRIQPVNEVHKLRILHRCNLRVRAIDSLANCWRQDVIR